MIVPQRGLYNELFASKAMHEIFSERTHVQAILDFEAALARAEAGAGVIPEETASAIAAHCRAKRFDLERIAEGTAVAGNVAIPLVAALTDLVARTDPAAAPYVHFGASSQDALDTALVLQLHKALDVFDAELGCLCDALANLVRRHRRSVLLGRTSLQPALPVTFGLKAAGWLSTAVRGRERLRALRPRVLVVQFGGAAGTLASLRHRGLDVATRLAQSLNLGVPDVPWHSARDRLAEVGAALGLVVGGLGKMARDLSLMTQREIGEAFESQAHSRGAPSTMPDRQSTIAASAILAAALRVPGLVATLFAAMPQEHERGLGGWQAEWDSLPEICLLTSGALMHAVRVLSGLRIDTERMRANPEATGGVILGEAVALALARHVGPQKAQALVERACARAVETGLQLRDVLETERELTNHFSVAELQELCDPSFYLGLADDLSERALAEHARIAGGSEK